MELRAEPGGHQLLSGPVRMVLESAQAQGLIGTADLDAQIRHSAAFLGAVTKAHSSEPEPGDLLVDLGSGGGLPGLVLATLRPVNPFALVEGSSRRAAFLFEGVQTCGWVGRVEVLGSRAEIIGHDHVWRGRAAWVFARGFGSPSETAECASGLLHVGGGLVISEPPGSDGSRWSRQGLARLGMEPVGILEAEGFGFMVIRQVEACPGGFPRRVGVPRKRPLF